MNTWAQKIIDLECAGWRQKAIALEMGVTQSSVSEIKQGRTKEPRGEAAVKLHLLHESECAKSRTVDAGRHKAA